VSAVSGRPSTERVVTALGSNVVTSGRADGPAKG
jgi:hypothetical protein